MVLNRIGDVLHNFFFLSFYCASCIWHGYWWTICPVEILMQWFLWLPRVTPSMPLSYRPSPTGPHGMITARWVLYIWACSLQQETWIAIVCFDQNFSHRHCNQIRLQRTAMIFHLSNACIMLLYVGWWLEPNIQGADISHHYRSWTWGPTPSTSRSFHSFQIIFGEQADAKIISF